MYGKLFRPTGLGGMLDGTSSIKEATMSICSSVYWTYARRISSIPSLQHRQMFSPRRAKSSLVPHGTTSTKTQLWQKQQRPSSFRNAESIMRDGKSKAFCQKGKVHDHVFSSMKKLYVMLTSDVAKHTTSFNEPSPKCLYQN